MIAYAGGDAGSKTVFRFTPAFTAPEVAAAYEGGEIAVKVAAASDVWALGLIAYELLTRKPAWPEDMSETQIWGRLCTRGAALPWELSKEGGQGVAAGPQRSGTTQKAIDCALQCLRRSASKRPSAAQLAAALQGVLDDEAADASP